MDVETLRHMMMAVTTIVVVTATLKLTQVLILCTNIETRGRRERERAPQSFLSPNKPLK